MGRVVPSAVPSETGGRIPGMLQFPTPENWRPTVELRWWSSRITGFPPRLQQRWVNDGQTAHQWRDVPEVWE